MSHVAKLSVYGDPTIGVPSHLARAVPNFDPDQNAQLKMSFYGCHERQARSWLVDARLHRDGEANRLRRQYTQDDLEYAKPAKLLLQCSYCGKTHIFKFSDARLKQIRH